MRVDLRTVDAEEAGARPDRPMVLGVGLSDDGALRPVEPRPTVYFEHPAPSTVYSYSTLVRCTAAKRADCRTIWVYVEHPWAGPGIGITIELKDAK